jgi:hypothetical protein
MGASQSSSTQNVSQDTSQEQTLTVTPSELLQVCMALARANVEVVATSAPSKSYEQATIWVRKTDNLDAMVESGALGEDVKPTPYTSKGVKVTVLDNNTTAVAMLQRCEEMTAAGTNVTACSSLAALGTKKIYHN